MNPNSKDNIEQALHSLDGMERATPQPFFYTRLEARMMKSNNLWEKISLIITRPVVAFATVMVIILMNAWAISSVDQEQKGVTREVATVEEYSQLNNEFIDIENWNP